MHGGVLAARDLFYGLGGGYLYVRLDGVPEGAQVQIEFDGGILVTPEGATGRVMELRTAFDQSRSNRFRVLISHNHLTPSVLPLQGWLALGQVGEEQATLVHN